VTLSGIARTTRNQSTSQNFVPTAAFTLLAHEFTFPPNDSENGAGAPGATSSNSAAASADQAAAAQGPPPTPTLTAGSVNATSVAVAIAAVQPSTSASTAGAAANTASSAATGSAGTTPAAAPQETLQQLDQELQRLGINPQDISLLNRMSLLLWVNDPVALRQFVQGTEPSAVASEKIPATNALDTQTNAAQFGTDSSANASQGGGAAAIQPGTPSEARNQSAVGTQDQAQEANQNSGVPQSSGISIIGTAGSPNPPQQQTAVAALQLKKLHVSLAVAGQDAEGNFAGRHIPETQGQFVNISA
jgi:hypothetical protein